MATRPPVRRKQPSGPKGSTDRARGALLGLAVGDALGTTLDRRNLFAPTFPDRSSGPHTEMKGGGPHSVKPGQITADTQQAVCLAESLKERPAFDAEDVAKRYKAWKPSALGLEPQAADALELLGTRGQSAATVGQEVWLRGNRQWAGAGSLARTSVLGVFFWKDRAARIAASLADSAITHFDPRCQLACAAFNGAVAQAVLSPKPPEPAQLVDAASTELNHAGAALGRRIPLFIREVQAAVEAVKADLAAAKLDNPSLYGPELHLHSHAGFVRVAFRLAFWELLHAPSFEAALIDTVNRGGAAATDGAVTGALYGACAGEAAIPERWAKPALAALSEPGRGPLWERYHPRHLLPLGDLGD